MDRSISWDVSLSEFKLRHYPKSSDLARSPKHLSMIYFQYMAKNWTHLFEKYRGKWVALAEDETTVLAAADTAKEARDAALKRSLLPILYQVPETLDLFAGYAL